MPPRLRQAKIPLPFLTGIVFLALLTIWLLARHQTSSSPFPREKAIVTFIFDGDTILLADGRRVRLIGIDAPEINPHEKTQCFGAEAKHFLATLLTRQTVELERDVSEKDIYNRLLRYVYLDGVSINKLLVTLGYAKALPHWPDTRYANQLALAEQDARRNHRGLWRFCTPS